LRSDNKPQLSSGGRRRLAVSLAGLTAVPVVLLAACGNAQHKISEDTLPDARASTEGAISAYPTVVPSVPVVSGKKLSGTQKQQAPVEDNPINQVPPEDLVSQQGFGERQ
jgi:hypothetical protein